jgi:gliding motility-associated lipoprotein GldH
MKNVFRIAVLFLVVTAACNRHQEVSQFHAFRNAIWQRFDHVNFTLPVENTDKKYDVYIVVRYTEKFPSDVLPVNVVMNTPGGEERIKDYNLFLKNKQGEMLGENNNGVFTQVIKIREGIKFDTSGPLKFDIENLMPKYYTPGIVEFGIVME